MKKRVLSLFMALMLCFSLLPTAMLAEEPAAAEAQTEQPVLEEPKQEEPVQSEEPAQAEEPDAQEGGLQEQETPSVPEKNGDESDAAVRSAQELIDALPHEATAENAEEIEAQLAVLEEMLAELTEEQTAMLDTTRYEALCKSLADLTVAQAKEHAAAYLKEGEKQAEADYEAAMNQARETAESLVKDAEARKKQAIETIAERIIEISVNH